MTIEIFKRLTINKKLEWTKKIAILVLFIDLTCSDRHNKINHEKVLKMIDFNLLKINCEN